MKTLIKLLIASVCAGTSMPVMHRKRWLPIPPSPERIVWEPDRSWYHNMKNEWVEAVRADAQWYGKFLMFVILTLTAALIAALAM